jgi:serine/threonine-protein kinase
VHSTEQLATALAGRYRIERHLGAGGMATVYLAQDLKHDRHVAIKVLKPELSAVLGAERFVQEIKTTAALQHPHILPLFDSGTADGFLYYVMPYIQGETIREKLNRETQFGVDEAVRIAREVADALDYAHRHGVIHRDIKPENILLHDGRAMVMDFGIALAVSAAAGGRMTETGLSLGTPFYMSPEQATAEKEITPRSDIYSLATVLYEMLAGQPPHIGGAAQQVIMKILTEDATPVSTMRKHVPANVVAALTQALEKLPADRFESARAFSDALTNPSFAGIGPMVAAREAGRGQPRYMVAAFAALALLSISGASWTYARWPKIPDEQVVRMPVQLPVGEQLYVSTNGTTVAISRQGDRIAITLQDSAGQHIYIRRNDELTGHFVGKDGATDLVFSPDGRWLAFAADNAIQKVPVDGGAPVTIAKLTHVTTVRGMAWLPSDTLVVGSFAGASKVSAVGGPTQPTRRLVVGVDSTKPASYPVLPPDGKTLALTTGLGGSHKLVLLAPGQTHFDTLDVPGIPALMAIGMRDGRLLFVDETGVLKAVRLDLKSQRTTGEAVPVQSGIRVAAAGAAFVSLSESGTLWYLTGEPTSRLMLWAPNGTSAPLLDDTLEARHPTFSPDGRKVAVSVSSRGASEIWVYDRTDRRLQKLTSDSNAIAPAWSPDGRRILFRSGLGGRSEIWWQRTDGSDKAEPLYKGEQTNEAIMSPNSKWLIIRTSPASSKFPSDVLAVKLDGDRTPIPIVAGPDQETQPRLSPDGNWLAYRSNESGPGQIYVRPFPNKGPLTQVSTAGGAEPVWSPSGNELYYRTPNGSIVAVGVTTGATFTLRGSPRVVLSDGGNKDGTHQNYDVSLDGKFVTLMPTGDPSAPVLVHNWKRELREKLASGAKK